MSEPKLLAYNDLEGVYDSPERIGKLAGLIGERRDGKTVVCGAGDDTALGTVALLSGDQRALARPFFEQVEPAAVTEKHEPIYRSAIEWARDGGLTDAARTGRIRKQD